MNYFKQKLPNNSCIGFPSALCSDLADGRFAAVETVTHLLQGSSELERPGCLLLRTFRWSQSSHVTGPQMDDGDKCLLQLARLSLCVRGWEMFWLDHKAPRARWDPCPACASLFWISHLPLDGVKRSKVSSADFTKGIFLLTAFTQLLRRVYMSAKPTSKPRSTASSPTG